MLFSSPHEDWGGDNNRHDYNYVLRNNVLCGIVYSEGENIKTQFFSIVNSGHSFCEEGLVTVRKNSGHISRNALQLPILEKLFRSQTEEKTRHRLSGPDLKFDPTQPHCICIWQVATVNARVIRRPRYMSAYFHVEGVKCTICTMLIFFDYKGEMRF